MIYLYTQVEHAYKTYLQLIALGKSLGAAGSGQRQVLLDLPDLRLEVWRSTPVCPQAGLPASPRLLPGAPHLQPIPALQGRPRLPGENTIHTIK